VLIKIGLHDIPALPFAGLRYTLAFLFLLPFALRTGRLASLRRLSRSGWLLGGPQWLLGGPQWLRLVGLGLLLYSVTQGAQFVSLFYLPAATTNLLLTFTSPLVALLGIALLNERPTSAQWGGTLLFLAGVLLYFYRPGTPQLAEGGPSGQAIGLAVAGLGVLANALSAILGRSVNRGGELSPMAVTLASMGVGGLALLAAGTLAQGLPRLTPLNWAIVLWLAAVNSALAFTLWNRTLRTLSAMESSLINNTMLFQIPVLAWLFLGEGLSAWQVAGMAVAAAGTFMVQVRGTTRGER
jgi:drug/metabolite transporter (DMT)-like permease